MTISTIYAPVAYDIVGAGPYAFEFDVINSTDILITIDEVFQSAATYVVDLTGSAPIFDGGSVTLNDPPASGDLVIIRLTERTQLVDYQPFGPFPAEIFRIPPWSQHIWKAD